MDDEREAPRAAEAAGEQAQPLARAALARRKRRDLAIVLPLAGLVAFASPLLDVVARGGTVAGVPVSVIFLFGAWFALIAATGRLARRLLDDGGEG